jgi:hypothetical protein
VKLWLLTQTTNKGFDTYDSCVVAASTEEAARLQHPWGNALEWRETRAAWCYTRDQDWYDEGDEPSHAGGWAYAPDQVQVTHVGDAAPGVTAGVVCASFNAG